MVAYYNEHDPYAAAWLRNLIAAGLIAPGHVDDRSIEDVRADDFRGFTQCHFFAGLGGWSYALRLAGWDDTRPVWSGSCPCQPFSAAGKGEAFDDERHLWPVWFELIRAVRPPVIFGEQVDDAIGWGWLDLVHDDMEAEGYSVRSAILPACGVGAPHIRDRLWFVADAMPAGRSEGRPIAGGGSVASSSSAGVMADASDGGRRAWQQDTETGRHELHDARRGAPGEPGDTIGPRLEERPGERRDDEPQRPAAQRAGDELCGMADTMHAERRSPGLDGIHVLDGEDFGRSQARGDAEACDSIRAPWSNLQWLPCTDGKARPTKPGIFPLAHGVSARVGKLRAAGNAIVPQVAAQFIRATQ